MIGILGTRTMARGIEIFAATTGLDNLVWCRSSNSLNIFNCHVAGWLQGRLINGKIGQGMYNACLNCFHVTTELYHLSEAEFVIEAVVGD